LAANFFPFCLARFIRLAEIFELFNGMVKIVWYKIYVVVESTNNLNQIYDHTKKIIRT